MKKIVFTVITIFILTSCRNYNPDSIKASMSEKELVSELGNPASEGMIEYTKDIELSEMYGNLYSIYWDIKAGDTIMVKELEWHFPNNDKLVIWLDSTSGTWKVVDVLDWPSGTKF